MAYRDTPTTRARSVPARRAPRMPSMNERPITRSNSKPFKVFDVSFGPPMVPATAVL